MIDIDFKFRAVGQGAFYTGIFIHRHNGNQFSFVYDCGTRSSPQYINQEIHKFVIESSHKMIDILFISHFHDDHINKISELLNQTGGAKIAILPYLTPEELLLTYIDVSLSGGDAETLTFITNPTAFLLERKVEQIIYIHPDDEKDTDENNEPNIRDSDPELPDFQFVISNQLKKTSIKDSNASVSHHYDSGIFSIIGIWHFKFFNKPRIPDIINDFILDVKTLLNIPSFDFNDLANYVNNNPKTFKTGFNKIYSKNFGARQLVNETSLLIYHGPLRPIKGNQLNHRRWIKNRCSGTLLTGDIIFNNDCFNGMILKWGSYAYTIDVGIFQIPHHGANNYLAHNITTSYPQVQWWVINFGLGNTHKHPHQDIVNMIIDNNIEGQIFCNTQTNELHYGCIIEK
jgi:hypothetical protein